MPAGRLVFGDDRSAAADVAWLWINSHSWPGWLVSVVEAHRSAEYAVLPPERTELHAWEPTHPRELIAGAPDTALEHLMAEADPRVVLDSCGEADLMVVGPRGSGALKQLHIGSTTEWLLARPDPPLVIVRNGRVTHRVLVCVDGSRHARRATEAVAALPWIAGCQVTVLAVAESDRDAQAAAAEAQELLRAADVEARSVVAEAPRGGLGAAHDVRGVILEEISELDVDLVALGTRGLGTLRRAIVGSTASAVALHAPCSVLVAYAEPED